MSKLKSFNYWCYKVLPLVYDDSLSYYEVLCKVVDRMNEMLNEDKDFAGDIESLRQDLAEVQKWIDNYDTTYAEKIIEEKIGKMIFVEISNSGYFKYYIPSSWSDVSFNTTGLDIELPDYEYGRLVLNY